MGYCSPPPPLHTAATMSFLSRARPKNENNFSASSSHGDFVVVVVIVELHSLLVVCQDLGGDPGWGLEALRVMTGAYQGFGVGGEKHFLRQSFGREKAEIV